MPVAAWVCGRSFSGIAGSNSAEVWIFVSCECCVLSGWGDPSFSGNLSSTCECVCVCVCVSLGVTSCNNNPPDLQREGRRSKLLTLTGSQQTVIYIRLRTAGITLFTSNSHCTCRFIFISSLYVT